MQSVTQEAITPLLGVVEASLKPNEHVVEVLLPVHALKVLPPKTQSGREVCISLELVSIRCLDVCSLRSTYGVESVEDEVSLDHRGLHVGFALPLSKFLDVVLDIINDLLSMHLLVDCVDGGVIVGGSQDDTFIVRLGEEVFLELAGNPVFTWGSSQLLGEVLLDVPWHSSPHRIVVKLVRPPSLRVVAEVRISTWSHLNEHWHVCVRVCVFREVVELFFGSLIEEGGQLRAMLTGCLRQVWLVRGVKHVVGAVLQHWCSDRVDVPQSRRPRDTTERVLQEVEAERSSLLLRGYFRADFDWKG